VGTEGQGLSMLWNVGLKCKLSEIGLGTFHVKFMAIVYTMKQIKRHIVWHQECKDRMEYFLEYPFCVEPS